MGKSKRNIFSKEGFWQEVFDIAKWYEDEVYELGDKFLAAIDEAIEKIKKRPGAYRLIRKNSTIRRYFIKRYSYKLYYSLQQDKIILLAVIHKNRSNKFIRRRLK